MNTKRILVFARRMAYVLAGIALLFVLLFVPMSRWMGGAFDRAPDQMNGNVSEAAQALISRAYADVNGEPLMDFHTHIVGIGTSSDSHLNARMLSWWHPIDRFKAEVYFSAAGIADRSQTDQQYLERLMDLARHSPHPGRHYLLALDHHYNSDGTVNEEKSEFYVSNEYVVSVAERYPDLFMPVISIHPSRPDALEELEYWARRGIRMMKWLPNAQGIDASDSRHNDFYQIMKNYDMVLLTHVGLEMAVKAAADQEYGNPLRFRRPLDLGLKVVMAHSASLGWNKDLDNSGARARSFDLFLRLMDEPAYEGFLFGELSAMTQFNRLPRPMTTLLRRKDLHHRLVDGSDYPLPAVNVVIQLWLMADQGFISEDDAAALREIYRHNPLVFDYVLKRTLRAPDTGEQFPASVFTGGALAVVRQASVEPAPRTPDPEITPSP